MFLTKGALPFARLWDAFFAGNEHLFNVYVHAWPFPGVNVLGRKAYHDHFMGRFIPSDVTERGTALLIAATRRLLANALLDDPMNEYFALLSEHCIPIRGFQHVYNVLTSSNKSFVQQGTDPQFWFRYTARGENAMLPEVEFSQFRGGSQFLVLVRRHAVLFVRDTKYWPKFNLPVLPNNPGFPEEHYFPTVLAIEDPNGTHPFTLTWVDWEHMDVWGHPKTYTKEEVSLELITFLQSCKGGVHVFARKFSDDSIDVLMGLTEHILRN